MNELPLAYFTSNNDQFQLLAIGCEDELSDLKAEAFSELDLFLEKHRNSYIFSCFTYDLKNRIEALESRNSDHVSFPELLLWKPRLVLELKGNSYHILQGTLNRETEVQVSKLLHEMQDASNPLPTLSFQARIPKDEYLQHIANIRNEIQYGNVYELNFCQEFYAENCPDFHAWSLVKKLNTLSKAPFSAYLKTKDHEVFCASPERFVKKEGKTLISQPIKGTSKRGSNPEDDQKLIAKLQNDPKERAENIMITDLVRNDFSRIAQKNSVVVDELCGVYTFETVHQLISTIRCEVDEKRSFSSYLKALFPMGSMTGAPKISAMEISEREEAFKRGLYSGSIGYFKPGGDFDLNVVIRSFILNREKKYLSCGVGGAITINSVPEKEYEECLVKVKAMIQLFGDDHAI